MKKIISTRQFAVIKRTAQNVAPLVGRKSTLSKKIKEMQEEIASLDAQISGFEGGIKAMCCGLGTEQLVHKTVTRVLNEDGTSKLDAKTGKPLTKTTYEPNQCITFNAEKNEYTLTVADDNKEVLAEEYDAAQQAFNGADADEEASERKAAEAEAENFSAPVADDSDPFNY